MWFLPSGLGPDFCAYVTRGSPLGWAIEKGLDAVSEGAKQWARRKRQRQLEKDSERKARPQSVIIKSFVTGEPERRIDVDSDGNVTEYRWVKIENAEHGVANDHKKVDHEKILIMKNKTYMNR
jgi:hypothetical protein